MRTATTSPAAVPDALENLSRFLKRLDSMGHEVAFWRSRGQSDLLESGVESLLSILHDATFFGRPAIEAKAQLHAFAELRDQIHGLVAAIPFQKRVNLLHRPLVGCYQQIMILENLTASIICRLETNPALSPEPTVPKGSLLREESRQLRETFRDLAPSWDRKEWNFYDAV